MSNVFARDPHSLTEVSARNSYVGRAQIQLAHTMATNAGIS